MKRLPRWPHGFTLVEMLVVIAIIALLASMLFPLFGRSREKARQSSCLSNQRQIAMAIVMYVDDHQRYPGPSWWSELQLPEKVLICQSRPEQKIGYAMNSYLIKDWESSPTGIHQAGVSNPSRIIATMDAPGTCMVTADMSRHNRGAIFSRCDGTVVWAQSLDKVGQYACGTFPLTPKEVINGQTFDTAPIFYNRGSIIGSTHNSEYKDFVIAGPYGDNSSGTWDLDFISETTVARLPADASPAPGLQAPEVDQILPPTSQDESNKDDSTKPVNQFKVWTVPGSDLGVFDMMDTKCYNSRYFGRTTYAATYVYSAVDQPDLMVDWWCDDVGMIWLNGKLMLTERTCEQVTPNTPTSPHKAFPLPKGVSYILVKTTNKQGTNTGGMKFKLRFYKKDPLDENNELPLDMQLTFSSSIE